jgi:hypothetical protein
MNFENTNDDNNLSIDTNSETPEFSETPEEQELRGEEMFAQYEKDHAQELAAKKKKLETELERAELIREFERLVSDFKEKFSLNELNKIKTKEEALASSLREGAKEALISIRNLYDKGSLESGKHRTVWLELSNAVGFINSGKVRHG